MILFLVCVCVFLYFPGMDYQGGGGGFGGGTPTSGTPSAGGRSGGGGGSRKSYDEQTIQPVTASMCLNSQPDADGTGDQLADGRKLYHVKLVGAVRSVADYSTNSMFEIEDGTGLIEVKQWIDANDCTALSQMRQACTKEHIYLAIVGQIKDYDGKKMIVADSIRPIATGNELTHHMLEVIYAGETWKRHNSHDHSMMMMNRSSGGVGFGGTSMIMSGGTPMQASTGHNSLRDAVLTLIRTEGATTDEGVSIPLCIQKLHGSDFEVRKIIEDLAAEGHIYSTVDDNHYKFAM